MYYFRLPYFHTGASKRGISLTNLCIHERLSTLVWVRLMLQHPYDFEILVLAPTVFAIFERLLADVVEKMQN